MAEVFTIIVTLRLAFKVRRLLFARCLTFASLILVHSKLSWIKNEQIACENRKRIIRRERVGTSYAVLRSEPAQPVGIHDAVRQSELSIPRTAELHPPAAAADVASEPVRSARSDHEQQQHEPLSECRPESDDATAATSDDHGLTSVHSTRHERLSAEQ